MCSQDLAKQNIVCEQEQNLLKRTKL